MPQEPEAGGLLALMLLQDARSVTRVDAAGRFVALEAQDRRLWNHAQIRAAAKLLESTLALRRPSRRLWMRASTWSSGPPSRPADLEVTVGAPTSVD